MSPQCKQIFSRSGAEARVSTRYAPDEERNNLLYYQGNNIVIILLSVLRTRCCSSIGNSEASSNIMMFQLNQNNIFLRPEEKSKIKQNQGS